MPPENRINQVFARTHDRGQRQFPRVSSRVCQSQAVTALSSSRRTIQTVEAYGPDMRVTYNKLIRDRLPEVIQADGRHAVTRVLDSRSYQAALLAKLIEEAQEAQGASPGELPAELADIFEVLQALVPTLSMTWQDLLVLAATKRQRGGFTRRLFLEYAESTG